MSTQPEVTLYPLERGNIRFSHPWIYKSQIKSIPKDLKPGAEVLVKSPKGSVIGVGYFNPKSEIAIRIVCRETRSMDKEFFTRRLRAAAEYRRALKIDSNAVRWVNSESDQLPGLVIDQYADTAEDQFKLALWCEQHKLWRQRREHLQKVIDRTREWRP